MRDLQGTNRATRVFRWARLPSAICHEIWDYHKHDIEKDDPAIKGEYKEALGWPMPRPK